MRIPHIINSNTLKVYTPSPECLELPGEIARQIKAEDFTWDDAFVPLLSDFAVQVINKNFENKPILDELPCEDRNYLLEILYLDLPLELMIPLTDDEFYWQRRYTEHFGLTTNRKTTFWTWKSLYLSRHVQKIIEEAQPQYRDEENMNEILDLCAPYTQRLFVTQLLAWKPPLTMEKEIFQRCILSDHINLICYSEETASDYRISISYGTNEVGEDFNWDMFKVSVTDCVRLGKAVLELKQIKILRVHRSNIEYKHCQALMQVVQNGYQRFSLRNC
nr:unnamed protein product [Callosobruchus chinensis]